MKVLLDLLRAFFWVVWFFAPSSESVRIFSLSCWELLTLQGRIFRDQQLIQLRALSIQVFQDEFLVSHPHELLSKVIFNFTEIQFC